MKPSALLATLLTAALAPHAASLGGDPGFRSGDLYFQSNVLFGPSTGNVGILRIDPTTGQSEVLLGPVGTGSGSSPNLAYDPYRDRLITSLSLDLLNRDVYFVDAGGNTASVGLPGLTVSNFAPAGDGRIYFTIEGGLAADIHYIDAAGALHQLLNEAGSAPFQLDPSAGSGTPFHGMIYEPGTRALFVASPASSFPCSSPDTVNVHKIPLSVDGARVGGPVLCAEYDIDPNDSSEHSEGLSRGPLGDLFLVVDTNSNNQQSRMLRIDPAGLTITSYASNGSYLGAAATDAGCYSHVSGRGAIVDSFAADVRLYSQGEVGEGTFLGVTSPPGTSLHGNGQQATLTEIGPVGPHYGLIGDTLALSVAVGGTQNWTIRTGAAFAGETYLVLGSVTGWSPPTPLFGLALPLVFDAYTVFTISHANSSTFPGSLGTLDPGGNATAALVLPPGAVGPGSVGTIAYHAALVLDGALTVVHVTNALPLELLP